VAISDGIYGKLAEVENPNVAAVTAIPNVRNAAMRRRHHPGRPVSFSAYRVLKTIKLPFLFKHSNNPER
jgi:hypothetical protein